MKASHNLSIVSPTRSDSFQARSPLCLVNYRVTPMTTDTNWCLVGFDEGVFSSRMFGAANLDDDDAQFGAEQVIIVRDFAEKKKLKDAIGDFALILTVMESKGMEFEDVLLYNFLTTSTSISDFRVLAGLVDTARFDQAKHIVSYHGLWYLRFVSMLNYLSHTGIVF